MTNVFQPKRVAVPGFLSEAGLTAGLENLRAQQKAVEVAAPPSTAATEFAQQIVQFNSASLSRSMKAIETTSRKPAATEHIAAQAPSPLAGNPMIGGVLQGAQAIAQLGTLTPEQSDAGQAAAIKAAEEEAALLAAEQERDLGALQLSNEERAKRGLPQIPDSVRQSMIDDAARNDPIDTAKVTERRVLAGAIKPTQTWWLNAAQTGLRSAAQMGIGAVKYPVDVFELTLGRIQKGGDIENSQAGIWLDQVDSIVTKLLPGDPAQAKDFVTELSAGVGSMAAFMIGGYVTKAIGLPAGLGAGVLGAAVEGNALYEEAEQFGATGTSKYLALLLGTALGATEAIPLDRAFMRADAATGGLVRRLLANTTATTLEEFTQELAQTAGEDLIAKFLYDYDRDLDPGAWLRAGVIGGITGAAAGTVTTLMPGGDAQGVDQFDEATVRTAVEKALDDGQVKFDAILGAEGADLGPVETEAGVQAPAGEAAQSGAGAVAEPVVRGDAVQQIIEPIDQEQQLAEAQKRAVETPEFKTFFEGSKVVDEAGAPMPVFHATSVSRSGRTPEGPTLDGKGASDFTAFRVDSEMGAHFGTVAQAEDRVTKPSGDMLANSRVFPVYLSLKNPLRVRDVGVFNAREMLDQQEVVDAIGDAEAGRLEALNETDRKGADRGLRAALQAAGYDGLVYLNRNESVREAIDAIGSRGLNPEALTDEQFAEEAPGAADSYVVFDPRQIKSAVANTGAYDPNSIFIDQSIASAVQSTEPEASELQPLPSIEKGLTGPIPAVVKAARAYAAAVGIPLRRQRDYVRVDTARAARIAQAYADMKHEPQDPAVASSYQAMAEETLAQYQYVKATGLVIEPIPAGAPNPYEAGPRLVLDDIRRGHMWYFPSEDGFGTEGGLDTSDNPLLEPTNEVDSTGRPMVVNDVFRVVHDFFGHGMEGSGFGARGEENAWQSHSRLYSASAIPAMTSETRGQNSWVNFGPFGEQNRAKPKETIYADQKSGLMPSWTWMEGVDDSRAYDTVAPVEGADPGAFLAALSAAKAASKHGAVVHAYTTVEYAEMRLFLSPDGGAGFALKGDDIVSVFSTGGGRLRHIMDAAIAHGGRRLDAFDGFLPRAYAAYGFREVGREKWNDEYRPEGWTDDMGRPDVVFMEYVGNEIEQSVARAPLSPKQLAERVPGIGPLLRHLTPKEQKQLTARGAEKLVEIFDTMPDPKEMAAVAFSARSKRGWYRRSAEALVDIFGVTDAPRFAALLAATSPQSSVEDNAINSLSVWVAWDAADRPTDRASILRILAENVQGAGTREGGASSALPAWENNVVRALSSEDPATMEITLSGPKVDSFMANLRGVVDEVTNDTWMANYGGFDQKVFSGRGTATAEDDVVGGEMRAKSPGYLAMSAAVRAAAKYASKATGEQWTPAEIQETIWSWARTLYIKARSEGTTVTALLKAGQITHEEIGNTPDFSTLFVEGVYRNILERGGYYRGIAEAQKRSLETDGADAPQGSPTAAEGSGFAQSAFDRHLRNAAERLDDLLAEERKGRSSRAATGTAPRSELMTDDDYAVELMTGTSSVRNPYVAEPTRPTRGVPEPATPQAPNDVRLTQISKQFTKLLNLTVRHGRLVSKGSNVMGEWNRRQATVRLRVWTDLSTLVHEGGHALNDMMSGPLDAFVAANEKAITAIGKKFYGADLTNAPPSTQRREGFAEFFRTYTMNPAYARKNWPQLVTDFEAVLDREDPKLRAGLNVVAENFAAWIQQPSTNLIRNMVVDGRREQGINAAVKELRDLGFKTWMQEHTRKMVEWSVNRYAPLNRLVTNLLNLGEKNRGGALDVARADDPRTLVRLARNAGSRGMVEVTDGVLGYRSTQSISRGLRDAIMVSQGLDPVSTPGAFDEEKLKDFSAYLVSRRALDEYRRFDDGLIARPPILAHKGDVIAAIRDFEKANPTFLEASEIVHEYGMALWQKQYDAGLMTKETYKEGLERRFYVPLQRDMSDKKAQFGDSALTGSGGALTSIVKRFRGSDRDIVDPLAILMHKTFALEQLIAENDAKRALAVLADRAGTAGALVERIPASQLIGEQLSVGQVARELTKDEDMSEADAADLMTILGASIKDGDTITLFKSKQAASKGENILFFWENGKVAAIQLKDGDLGADVVNTMNAIGRENMDWWMDAVAGTSTVFRTAITSWPDFLVVNYIRDQLSAWVLTDVGFTPFVSGIRGVIDEVRQKHWAKSYNAAQGIMGGMNVAALHKSRIDRDIGALRSKGYLAQAFSEVRGSWDLIGMAKGLGRVTAITETGTRLGLYRGAFERAKKEGLDDYQASVEAAYTATDYIDFGLNGSKMLATRRMIPFINAQLQGLYKMVRTLGADEVAQRKGLKFVLGAYFKSVKNLPLSRIEKQQINTGRKAWVKMMALGAISAALHFLFEDDPDYQETSEYMRVTGWVIPLGDGRIFYIPKPFELALVANAVERGLEFASGDTTAKDRFLRGVLFSMTPPTSPPAIQIAVELTANRDFFTGRDIVPSYTQALEPALQYDNYTSSLAKWMGATFNWSPMVIDHVLSGLGASAYRDISTMLNMADPTRPAVNETDAPILRRFLRDVRRGSVSAQDFWGQASTASGALERNYQTYKRFVEAGNQPAANQYLNTLAGDQRAYALLMTHFKTDAKRLNPFYRARQMTTVVSAMRREMASELGLGDTTVKDTLETIQLNATRKRQIDEILSEIARREVRNTLITTGQPGWGDKDVLPVQPTLDMLLAVSPEAFDEYERRVRKAKIYDAETVFDYWPDIRDRLISDGEFAQLGDAVAVAGVGF